MLQVDLLVDLKDPMESPTPKCEIQSHGDVLYIIGLLDIEDHF